MKTRIKLLNEILNHYGSEFEASSKNTLYNVLWSIIVSETYGKQNIAFNVSFKKNCRSEEVYVLALSHYGNSINKSLNCVFSTRHYEEALAITKQLNQDVFALSEYAMNKIVLSCSVDANAELREDFASDLAVV